MRKAVLLSIMVLAGVLGIRAQRTWVEPSPSAYASHAVVYAAFVDKQGKPVEVRDCMVGAFKMTNAGLLPRRAQCKASIPQVSSIPSASA